MLSLHHELVSVVGVDDGKLSDSDTLLGVLLTLCLALASFQAYARTLIVCSKESYALLETLRWWTGRRLMDGVSLILCIAVPHRWCAFC